MKNHILDCQDKDRCIHGTCNTGSINVTKIRPLLWYELMSLMKSPQVSKSIAFITRNYLICSVKNCEHGENKKCVTKNMKNNQFTQHAQTSF